MSQQWTKKWAIDANMLVGSFERNLESCKYAKSFESVFRRDGVQQILGFNGLRLQSLPGWFDIDFWLKEWSKRSAGIALHLWMKQDPSIATASTFNSMSNSKISSMINEDFWPGTHRRPENLQCDERKKTLLQNHLCEDQHKMTTAGWPSRMQKIQNLFISLIACSVRTLLCNKTPIKAKEHLETTNADVNELIDAFSQRDKITMWCLFN